MPESKDVPRNNGLMQKKQKKKKREREKFRCSLWSKEKQFVVDVALHCTILFYFMFGCYVGS